jgi:hypothetical protein
MSCESFWQEYLDAAAKHESATQALNKQRGPWASTQEDLVPAFSDDDFQERAHRYEEAAAAQTEAVEKFAQFYEHHRMHTGARQAPGHDVAVN